MFKVDGKASRRRIFTSLFLGALTAVLMTGCSEDDTTKPPTEFAPPTNLTYMNGDGQVTISWDASPDGARNDFAGYNVYRHTSSLAGVTGSELATHKRNSTPLAGVTYIDVPAQNGIMYFYTVRGQKTNNDLTAPTNEIDTAARPQGLVTLAEFLDPSRPSGLDLSEGEALAMSSSNPDNRPFIDIYLGTTGVMDEANQPLALKSPHLVLGGSPNWTRQAGLKLLADPSDATTPNTGWLESVTLGATPEEVDGKVIAVRTPLTEGVFHYGKLIVVTSAGPAGQREVQFVWAHQEIASYIRF